jgi:hypothetical protein
VGEAHRARRLELRDPQGAPRGEPPLLRDERQHLGQQAELVHLVGSTEHGTYGAAKLPLGAWSHLASSYDGATLRFYVNGAKVAEQAVPGSITTSNGDLRIGGNAIWGEWFSGLIDEVRIYNSPLGAAEIQADSQRPV